VVGGALVWLPTALYVLVTGEVLRGVLLLLWGAIAVGSVDNFVRPLVIGGRVEMPTLLLLFALLGGLQVYGFLGIFVAPVVVAVLLAFVDIYRETYVSTAPSPASGDAG
jgi:predicted PurR-regulated permease PerM